MMVDPAAEPGPSEPHDGDDGQLGNAQSLQAQIRAAREDLEHKAAHARENFEHQVANARENFGEANERIKQRTGRDLILAILIGVGIGAVVLGSLLFVKEAFILIALAGGLLGTFELTRALQSSGRKIDVVPQLLAAAAIIASAYFVDVWLVWVLLFVGVAVIIVWRTISQMMEQDGRIYADVLSDVLVGTFVLVYVSLPTALALLLLRTENGQFWVIAFIAVAVAADTGAYAIGLWIGKHPMAPRVSPKKTWEGFGGAALFALIAAILLCTLLLQLPWWTGIIFGAAILITATLGDLGESLLKRDLGIKDMSSWLPGHGGVLDRLDSILPSAVAGLALFQLLSPLAAA